MNNLEPYLERIRADHPDQLIRRARLDEEGMQNVVVIVNEEVVFRFARNAFARLLLVYESELLTQIGPGIDLEVPRLRLHQPDYGSYPFLSGEPLYRHRLQQLSDGAQNRVVQELAQFLEQLHSTPSHDLPHPPWDITVGRAGQKYETRYRAVVETLYPLLWQDQIAWIEALFEPVRSGRLDLDAYTPQLIHNDLASYHILYSLEEECLSGILDFGTAALGDTAQDWGILISTYGESLLERMAPTYAPDGETLERARFYAGAIELEWALLGIEKNDLEMLLVHLGRARDGRLPG